MEIISEFGLNVINKLLQKGFDEMKCNEMDIVAYNINLDFILRLLNKYTFINKISLFTNTEKMFLSKKNKEVFLDYHKKGILDICHFSENISTIHAKLYRFKKDGNVVFLAAGSPNFTDESNKNFEFLVFFFDNSMCEKIWNIKEEEIMKFNLNFNRDVPSIIIEDNHEKIVVDQKYLEGLWKHQAEILQWAINKNSSIINIPTGTGKTEIAIRFIKYLLDTDKNVSIIILVPTITLIKQWSNRLNYLNIKNTEWGTKIDTIQSYFANPKQHILITLYSRFFDQYNQFWLQYRHIGQNLFLLMDECHNVYGNVDKLIDFNKYFTTNNKKIRKVALSATIDSFNQIEVKKFIQFMGGESSIFEISLQKFYSYWNNLNQIPVTKQIHYIPLKYNLNSEEMKKLSQFNKQVAIEFGKVKFGQNNNFDIAIKRAKWLRGLNGGITILKDYITKNIADFSEKSTLIFVQTNRIAEDIQTFITQRPGWNPKGSVYIYDSSRDGEYHQHALEQFKKNNGFCLISERMLSEGFDLPKIDMVILHGTYSSPRDWIQKVGRAIRYDKSNPDAIAQIVDIVYCDKNGKPLSLESERYDCLSSISI